jgi:hypothetical protein
MRPWRSPYLRWRIETYWGLHADRITGREFCAFVWKHRGELWRFLKWADSQEAASKHRGRIVAGD